MFVGAPRGERSGLSSARFGHRRRHVLCPVAARLAFAGPLGFNATLLLLLLLLLLGLPRHCVRSYTSLERNKAVRGEKKKKARKKCEGDSPPSTHTHAHTPYSQRNKSPALCARLAEALNAAPTRFIVISFVFFFFFTSRSATKQT